MEIRELRIADSYEITPRVFPDERGSFHEAYRREVLARATGRSIDLAQVNTSISRRGVVRGIHYADVPPSQAKYVTVAHGAIIDFIVDIRVGSSTFGEWDSVMLDGESRRSVFLSEGLGHAFVALTDDAAVTYFVTAPFNPSAEHGINPLDPAVGLDFTLAPADLLLSPKDTDQPSLEEAHAAGMLPDWAACNAFYSTVKEGGR